MKAHIKFGRIFGIEIGLHLSWFIIALLIVLSLSQQFRLFNPGWGAAVNWITAIVTGLLFFLSIIIHELSHALVAKARNLPVRSITLFALGGVAQIEREASEPSTEFWMGIVGPITSAVIGFLCLAFSLALGWSPTELPQTPLPAMFMWLGVINISLAIFNMIPGFPLDGGRVLRAVIWWITGDGVRATRWATRVGQIVAFGFITAGIIRFFSGAGFDGLWLAFIGWFLMDAATASKAQIEVSERLRGIRAHDLVERNCTQVDGNTNLQTFVNEHLLRTGNQCFLVRDDQGVLGVITPFDVMETDRSEWSHKRVVDVMRPLSELPAVSPDAPIMEAVELMERAHVNELPVVRGGRTEGVITRGGLMRLFQLRPVLEM